MRFDVIITGGGVVGIALALSLNRRGFHVALVEKLSLSNGQPVSDQKQVFMLNLASLEFLEEIGFMNQFPHESVHDVFEIRVRGDKRGEVLFDSVRSGFPRLGVTIQKEDLVRVLRNLLLQSEVTIFDEDSVSQVKWNASHVYVKLSKASIISCNLMVAADGVSSKIRKLANIGVTQHDFHQVAVVSRLTGRSANGVAYQWFQKGGDVLALLPIGASEFGVVWSMSKALGEEIIDADPSMFYRNLKILVGDNLGNLRLSGPISYFPLTSVSPLSVVGDRMALVGDAAGTVHPMAGQGLNLGLSDASILTDVLTENPKLGLSSKLRQYQRRRSEKVAIIRHVTWGLHKLFSSNASVLGFARNLGMSIFDRSALLKRVAIRIASR